MQPSKQVHAAATAGCALLLAAGLTVRSLSPRPMSGLEFGLLTLVFLAAAAQVLRVSSNAPSLLRSKAELIVTSLALSTGSALLVVSAMSAHHLGPWQLLDLALALAASYLGPARFWQLLATGRA